MTTAAGLFENQSDAESAIAELIGSGHAREDISVVAPQSGRGDAGEPHIAVKDAEKGAVLGGLAGLLLGVGELMVPGVGLVLVGGWLAAALLGAGVGLAAGGLAGALVEAGMHHEKAAGMASRIERGATLVTVRTARESVGAEEAIMRRHGAEIIQRPAQSG